MRANQAKTTSVLAWYTVKVAVGFVAGNVVVGCVSKFGLTQRVASMRQQQCKAHRISSYPFLMRCIALASALDDHVSSIAL